MDASKNITPIIAPVVIEYDPQERMIHHIQQIIEASPSKIAVNNENESGAWENDSIPSNA